MIEGIDYSSGGPLTSAEIKSAGKSFVGRYAVNDKSPGGRGISAAEYAELSAGGVDVFVYWESSEGWMLEGKDAGIMAAINAQQNINGAGMPNLPVYFACDVDAEPGDQDAIDDCLRGCAQVLGVNRVGLYAGYWPLLRAMQNKTARWFCQTLAWSGGNLLPEAHLYQYDTSGNYIDGVDVDLVRALRKNYGQASLVGNKPAKRVKRIPVPAPWQTKTISGNLFVKHGGVVTAAHDDVKVRQYADLQAAEVDDPLTKGKRVRTQYIVEGDSELWYISPGGARMLAKDFVE